MSSITITMDVEVDMSEINIDDLLHEVEVRWSSSFGGFKKDKDAIAEFIKDIRIEVTPVIEAKTIIDDMKLSRIAESFDSIKLDNL